MEMWEMGSTFSEELILSASAIKLCRVPSKTADYIIEDLPIYI